MKKQSGFTLIELMIVVAIIAIIAAIAIPNLLSARLNANETSAISTLRNVSSSQAQFQASAKCDVDADGAGEFGLFRELSGAVAVRTTAAGAFASGTLLNPPVLSGAFRSVTTDGEVSRSGYIFHMFLPKDSTGAGQPEGSLTSATTATDANLAETTWCCYSSPANYSTSGNRTFFVNQTGDITGCDYSGYTGTGKFVAANAGAAFAATGATLITGRVAIGVVGSEAANTSVWKQIN